MTDTTSAGNAHHVHDQGEPHETDAAAATISMRGMIVIISCVMATMALLVVIEMLRH
ncbi:MAG: hypothetical protein KDJ37_04675 [Hyphomicrobiaceae bacterium]|nr:hypothetical protein [Hyphomicrobiaceae bacterium]